MIERNGLYGILIGDFGRVHNCTISGPVATKGTAGSNGIVGGDNVLITNNTVVGNQTGILVGHFGTVSRNTSSGNTVFGVLALDQGVFTGNKTNDNGAAGIDTGAGSTVSRNIPTAMALASMAVAAYRPAIRAWSRATQRMGTGIRGSPRSDSTPCPATSPTAMAVAASTSGLAAFPTARLAGSPATPPMTTRVSGSRPGVPAP